MLTSLTYAELSHVLDDKAAKLSDVEVASGVPGMAVGSSVEVISGVSVSGQAVGVICFELKNDWRRIFHSDYTDFDSSH